jgi:hypothetical protein
MADNRNNRKIWQDAAGVTPECLPLEVLEKMTEGAAGDAKAKAHLAGCPHCQTELSMLKSFEASVPSADEGAAVAWIAAQLERNQNARNARQTIARVPFWRAMFRMPYLAGAAALAVVLALGISLYRSMNVEGPTRIGGGSIGSSAFRSGAVHLVSPVGEQAQAPVEFRWEAVPDAISYVVELKDVANQTLASSTSTKNTLAVTPEMRANMAPGKPLNWKVTALDASGKPVADSTGGNFKVK